MAVEEILYTDNLRNGTNKINASIRQANKSEADSVSALTTSTEAKIIAESAENKSDYTQSQLDDIVIESGTSDAETIQARGTETLLYKRLDKTDQQLADTTEDLEQRGVNAKKKNLVGDGVSEDSITLQNLINQMRDQVISTNFLVQNVLIISSGRYKISNQVKLSPFVKLKAMGTVIFETYVANDSAFHVTASSDDPSFLTIMNKQQWFRSPLINGTDGGFVFVNKLDKATSNSTAIEFGSRTDLSGTRPLSRYTVCDVAVENYNKAFKMNRFRHYIGTFERIHLELNNTLIEFGEAGQNAVDSGENFNFLNSVFAISETAVSWLSDGFDCRFVNCSFDYLQRVFYMKRTFKNVTVLGGHIENIGQRVEEAVLTGGIIVLDSIPPTDTVATVSLNGISVYVNKRKMFKDGGSGKLRVSIENIQHRLLDTDTKAENAFLADKTINIVRKDLSFQGNTILPSVNVNLLRNPYFINDADSTGTDLLATPPGGYTVSRGNISSNKIISTDGLEGGKAIEVIANTTTGYFTLTTTTKQRIVSGEQVVTSMGVKSANLSTVNYTAVIKFYSDDDVLLQTTSGFLSRSNAVNSQWSYPQIHHSAITPNGSAYFKVDYLVSGTGLNGVPCYMSGLYATVLK